MAGKCCSGGTVAEPPQRFLSPDARAGITPVHIEIPLWQINCWQGARPPPPAITFDTFWPSNVYNPAVVEVRRPDRGPARSRHPAPRPQRGTDAEVEARSRPLLTAVDQLPLNELPQRIVTGVSGVACVCGHGRSSHEHHRRGKDCGLCDCQRFRRNSGLRHLINKLSGGSRNPPRIDGA